MIIFLKNVSLSVSMQDKIGAFRLGDQIYLKMCTVEISK